MGYRQFAYTPKFARVSQVRSCPPRGWSGAGMGVVMLRCSWFLSFSVSGFRSFLVSKFQRFTSYIATRGSTKGGVAGLEAASLCGYVAM